MAAKEKEITDMLFEVIRQKLVIEGWIPDINTFPGVDGTDPDIVEGAYANYLAAMKTIASNKGYCIDVIGFSSSQYKDEKKTCRIVIDVHQFLPSELGNETTPEYIEHEGPNNTKYYTRTIGITSLSDLTFSIYAIGFKSDQMITMNKLIMECLPRRGYLKPLGEPQLLPAENFFIRLTDKGRTFELPIGIMERYFVYQIMDCQETEGTQLPGNIPAIIDIGIDASVENNSASS
jgi:hypothetical protein